MYSESLFLCVFECAVIKLSAKGRWHIGIVLGCDTTKTIICFLLCICATGIGLFLEISGTRLVFQRSFCSLALIRLGRTKIQRERVCVCVRYRTVRSKMRYKREHCCASNHTNIMWCAQPTIIVCVCVC